MYNRYLPPDTPFHPIPQEEEPPRQTQTGNQRQANERQQAPPGQRPPGPRPPGSELLGELTGGITEFLGGLFKNFSLENLDSGDILLLLIILFLFLEGDNLDLVIALGLMLLLGLGEDPQPST